MCPIISPLHHQHAASSSITPITYIPTSIDTVEIVSSTLPRSLAHLPAKFCEIPMFRSLMPSFHDQVRSDCTCPKSRWTSMVVKKTTCWWLIRLDSTFSCDKTSWKTALLGAKLRLARSEKKWDAGVSSTLEQGEITTAWFGWTNKY